MSKVNNSLSKDRLKGKNVVRKLPFFYEKGDLFLVSTSISTNFQFFPSNFLIKTPNHEGRRSCFAA